MTVAPDRREAPFRAVQSSIAWQVEAEGFDPAREHAIESMFAVGNGYLGVRHVLPLPGAWGDLFVAGVYDRKDEGLAYSELEFLAPERGEKQVTAAAENHWGTIEIMSSLFDPVEAHRDPPVVVLEHIRSGDLELIRYATHASGDPITEVIDEVEQRRSSVVAVGLHGDLSPEHANVLLGLLERAAFPLLVVRKPPPSEFRLKVGDEIGPRPDSTEGDHV